MLSLFRFSGRLGRGPYGWMTLAFCLLVFVLAALQTGAPFTRLIEGPWTVLGRALDDAIKFRPWPLDLLMSVGVALPLMWILCALTIRRLRDLGQSPWWALLVLFSGITLPVMIVLSMVRQSPEPQPTDRPLSA